MLFKLFGKKSNYFNLSTDNQYIGSFGNMIPTNTKFEKVESNLHITADHINLVYNISDVKKVLNNTVIKLNGIFLYKGSNYGVLTFEKDNQKVVTAFYLFKKRFERLSK